MTDHPLAPDIAAEAFDRAMAAPAPRDAAAHDLPPAAGPEDYGFTAPAGGGGDDDGGDNRAPDLSAEDLVMLDRCAAEPANDIGNGRRLRHRFGDDVISVQRVGFHVYVGTHWREDIEGAVTRPLTHSVVEWLALEHHRIMPSADEARLMETGRKAREELKDFAGVEKPTPTEQARIDAFELEVREAEKAYARWQGRKTARRRFAITAGNSGKLDGMLKEAAPYISRPVAALDADPMALNCQNGTVRLAAVNLADLPPDPDAPAEGIVGMASIRPHAREDLIAKLAPVPWCPEAQAPTFTAFIETVLPNPAVRDFVQRYCGYALTALVREQVFVLFHGEGRNGKSTFVDVVSKVMGDYATTVPVATLIGEDRRKGAEATPDLVRLPGARLVRTAEPKEGMGFDESLIKQLTGGEPILVRRLNQEFVEVYPTFKLIISCNRKPTIKGDDDGIWRRVMMVPWEVQIPEDQVDRDLPNKLWAERAGVLAWLIEGAKAYLVQGLDPPPEVRGATQDYRDESDIIGSFVRGALDITGDPHDTIEAGELYKIYTRWCERSSITPFQQTTFNRRMPKQAEKLHIPRVKVSIMTYQGVRPRPGFEAAPPSRTHYGD